MRTRKVKRASRSCAVYMGRLRAKLGADLIRSVQAVGYELIDRPVPSPRLD